MRRHVGKPRWNVELQVCGFPTIPFKSGSVRIALMAPEYPVLQIALDTLDLEQVTQVATASSEASYAARIWLEAGTPLIKKHGTAKTIETLKEARSDSTVVADMKTLDVGWLEVRFAAEDGANIVAVSGLANSECIEGAIDEARSHDIRIMCDMMNVVDPVSRLRELKTLPDIVLLHRGIDAEDSTERAWHLIPELKSSFPDVRVAVAGGINPETGKVALRAGADVIIVGRAVTGADSYTEALKQFEFIAAESPDEAQS